MPHLRICTLFSFVIMSAQLCAQTNSLTKIPGQSITSGPVYNIKNTIDIPLTVATVGWSLYGMSKIYNRDPVPESEVLALDPSKINRFDRPIADNYDTKAKDLSDKFFYGSMPLPLVLLLDKKIRKDGLRVALLYLEAMGTTGTFYTLSAMTANRFRPYAYNSEVDIATRTRGGARNSFYAGHPSVVATSAFFVAQVYADYHPEMRNKWVLFTLAGGATLTTGLLRLKAGQHFKSDVVAGITMGTLSGILIPHFHKTKNGSKKLSFYPNYRDGQTGLTALLKL